MNMDAVAQLLAMDNVTFRQLADRDLRGKATAEESAALRTPQVAEKWRTALMAMTKSVDGQLGARRADFQAARARFTKQLLAARYEDRLELERSWAEYRENYARSRGATLRFKSGLEETMVEARSLAEQARVALLGVQLWRFEDAPENLRALSGHAGDEDWIMLIPGVFIKQADSFENAEGQVETTVEFITRYSRLELMAESLDTSHRPEWHVLPNGDVVVIGAHA